jgi:hypothetical protein
MANDYELKLHLDHVKVILNEATEETLLKLAYRIVERAQMNIRDNNQIDTGFMVNSIYPIWRDGSGYENARNKAEQQNTDREGHFVDHQNDMAPEIDLPQDAAAAVVVAAIYAIYQEARMPFLYPAAEGAANEPEFRGVVEKIFKEYLQKD